MFADADGLGPALRDDEAADVAEEHEQDAEVEERAADAEQAALVQLGGASLTYTFHEQDPVQFTPCVERTTLSCDHRSR
ncbi:hypothetical protein GCM10023191_079820 [Actinoallomurus oryzae]|uniref:Uncharacterized protein n=1 Tax=Actinoallomurus oryzae TaxID=502180 RepID=A0ABP8QY74_9ACTN